MLVRSGSKRSQSGQAIVMLTIMTAFVLIPVVGLAIDGSRGYLIRLKLSAAVDGGALAAGRLMGTGATQAIQQANTIATAKLFVKANFPAGFFGASLQGNPNICLDPGTDTSNVCGVSNGGAVQTYHVRTVSVGATAKMPAMFMGILGIPTINVASTGLAQRRDVRVVLAVDRSGSMSGYFGTSSNSIIPMAQAFVDNFSGGTDFGGRDQLGLVVFGGSGIVAYPARNIANDFTDYRSYKDSPPDNQFKTNPKGTIDHYLGKITSGSNTGTAEALYLAYMTLRADAATNADLATKLNVIVLFTDGIPNGLTVFANDKNLTQATNQNFMLKAGSGCVDLGKGSYTTPEVGGTNMIGWLAQEGGNVYGDTDSSPQGLGKPMMAYAYSGYSGAGDDIDSYLSNAGADDAMIPQWNDTKTVGKTTTGPCASGTPMSSGTIAAFPKYDLFGNYIDLKNNPPPSVNGLSMPMGSTGKIYEQGTLWSTSTQCNSHDFVNTSPNDACMGGLAAWQAAAHQAWKIWNQVIWDNQAQANIIDPGPNLSTPVIFTIGFSHDASDLPDMKLLQIIANDPASAVPFSKRINGQAFLASTTGAVQDAFNQISAEILRLSR